MPPLALLVLSSVLLTACGDWTFNSKNGIKESRDTHGSLVLELTGHKFPDHTYPVGVDTKDVTLVIPSKYNPELLGGNVYINFQLPPMKPWASPPPLPPELASGLWIYERKKLSDPETRKTWEGLRERDRLRKRVALDLLSPAFSTMRKLEIDYRLNPQYGPAENPQPDSNSHVRDGDVAGLKRFSMRYCFAPNQLEPNPEDPPDRRYLNRRSFLKHKAPDDPTPEYCALNRHNSLFISPPDVPLDDSVYIECSPVLFECDVYFQAGHRQARVRLDENDVVIWQEIIGPIRNLINGFVLPNERNSERQR